MSIAEANFGNRSTTQVTDRMRKIINGSSKFKPRERHPDEALPNTIDLMALPDYVPPAAELPIRPGALNYRNVASRGISC